MGLSLSHADSVANPATTMQAVPEQGQLVRVRGRQFVVNDVAKSALTPSLVLENGWPTRHLVTLASVEDDALGEELQVVWELEPAAKVFDGGALPVPHGFDHPSRLDAFLNAVRWGAASTADVRALQAPFRSGIEIEDYQLDPLVRAVQMPRANLLIADDVGLGKTIEAGLVLQELIIRHRARSVLIVCPAALQIQWRDQMRDKFGLEFRIVDAELMKSLRRQRGIHVNPWRHFPRLIVSIDYLKRERPMRLLREVLPPEGELKYPRPFDLLIADEAHNVAPSGRGRYATDSLRTDAIRVLASHFEHKLFLTATPHNGYAESFSALLELLDNQRFARGIPPDPAILQQVMVRRLKSELPPRWDGSPRFPCRQLHVIEVAYSDEERLAHHWLQTYTRLRHSAALTPAERTASEFVLKLLKKRLFSSPAAFAHTLEKHRRPLVDAERPAHQAGIGRQPQLGVLRSMIESAEEEYGDDTAFEEATDATVDTASRLFRPPDAEEQRLLDQMGRWAERSAARADSKARKLIEWLHQQIKPNGVWSDRRVIIFTEYRDTQKWLQTLLAAEGLTQDGRLLTLYGGMQTDERERIKAAFQAGPEVSQVRILLATDAASEGIDLQLHCSRLIHYEIPWNPNRMEQRNGRIDRHGQRHPPLIYHFAPAGYDTHAISLHTPVGQLEGDLEFLMVAVRKVEQIREDLGKVGPVIADQVTEAMLGRRERLQTEDAERAAQPVRRMLKFERDLNARIEKLNEQLHETRNVLNLTPENVQSVVEIGLELAGQPPLQQTTLPGIWPDPAGQRQHCPVFRVPALHGSWARCTEGLAHPHTGDIRPIVFDHNLVRGRDDVVLAHLNHPLVQMALRLLRAEVWRGDGAGSLHRVAVRVAPDHTLQHPVVIAHGRLVIIGGDSHRLHEELIQAGGELREGRLARRLNVGETLQALNAALDVEPSAAIKAQLQSLWPNVEQSLRRALEARAQERATSLQRQLGERRDKEIADITAILSELQHSIETELDEPEVIQLELFSTAERDQYNRNQAALLARLAQIPLELEKETDAVDKRFADPQTRLFPVAVTFLIPKRLA